MAGALALMAAPASAQTGYPPGPCSVLAGSQFAGNVTVGQSFTVTVAPTCLFTPGSASVVVNGSTAFSKPVNADGTVTVTVTILSTTEASVNPIVPVACGINTIAVTAPSSVAGGRSVTQAVTFNLICPGVPIVNICNAGDGGDGGGGVGLGGPATAGSGTSSGTGSGTGGTSTGGSGTGIGGGAGAGGDACNVTLVSGPASTGTGGLSGGGGGGGGAGGAGGSGGAGGAGGGGGAGGSGGGGGSAGAAGTGSVVSLSQGFLARTGSTVAPYALLALALVLAGTVMTVAARRRRAYR